MEEFTLSLQRRLAPQGDLVWSPYSVASALALIAAGARGATHEELVGVLGAPPADLRLAEAAAARGAEIAVATMIWARAGLIFQEAYERAIAGLPGGASRVADFAAGPDEVRQAINTEVEKLTRELITGLLPAGSVTRDTAAVLVSALYLKAAWQVPFATADTRPGPFHGPGGRREVPMMRRTGRMPYAEADGWRLVTLAAGGDVQADVLLGADEAGGPPPAPLLRTLRGSARPVRVELSLPRFRVESRADLIPALHAAGVRRAFGADADLSGMSAAPVRLDRVQHMAVLDVGEAGLEGAAATAAVMQLASFDRSRPVVFRVDRPFSVLVRHATTGVIYFSARVATP